MATQQVSIKTTLCKVTLTVLAGQTELESFKRHQLNVNVAAAHVEEKKRQFNKQRHTEKELIINF